MPDAIDVLCKECGFDDILNKKKAETNLMVRHIIATYEAFYGESSPTHPEVVKRMLRVVLEFSPASINLALTKGQDIQGKVLDRVVEKIYKAAEEELLKEGTIKYVV